MKSASIDRKTGKIDSLQALRAMAFLGIFLVHAGFFVSWPTLGVSIFYVMSGFLMSYRYEQVELKTSIKSNFEFSLKKIKKLYPLHILTMFCAIILNTTFIVHEGVKIKSVTDLLVKTILNITLLQTWIPNSNICVSLNGVAWYLSVAMFLYFMFPRIKKIIDNNSVLKLCIISGAILVVEVISCIPFITVFGNDSPVYIWFMYCFPVFRLGDFFIGCVLKKVYFECNFEKTGIVRATVYEIIATALTILVFLWIRTNHKNVVLLSLQNWTTVNIFLATIWIILFIENNGLITKALTNKLFIFMGNISAYAFLIHKVVTDYTERFLSIIQLDAKGWSRAFLVLVELGVSLLLSVLYKRVHEKFKIVEDLR